MWRSKDKYEDSSKLEAAQCPVCHAILGKRDKDTIFIAHCEECKATFHWKPWTVKPSVTMDKDIPVKCGCGGCGR